MSPFGRLVPLLRHTRAWIFALLTFGILASAYTFPLVLHLGDSVREKGDTLLVTWILAWDVHALTTSPLGLFNANIFFPFPNSLTYSEVMIGGAIFAAPIIWLTGNPILAHNLLLVLSFAVSGFAVYCLAHHLTHHHLGSLLAGVIFGFCPYRFDQISHLPFLLIQWLPFALLFLHRGFKSGRTRDFLIFALFFVLQAWSSFYYAFFAALTVGVFVAYELIVNKNSRQIAALQRFVLAIVVCGVLIVPFGVPYFESQKTFGFQRNLAEVQDLSAAFQDYFAAPPENLLYGSLTSPFRSHTTWPLEHYLFPGLVGPLLALLGMASLRRRAAVEDPVRGGSETESLQVDETLRRSSVIELEISGTRDQLRYTVLALAFFVLSLGPHLQIFGHLTRIPLPYLVLYQYFPGFTALRAPVRFDIIVMLGVSVLAAYGLARLDASVRKRGVPTAFRAAGTLLITIAAAAEFVGAPLPLFPMAAGAAVPPVYGWLATHDPSAPVAEVPATQVESFVSEYFSVYHWHPLVNGQSGFTPPGYSALAAQINDFPSPQAVDDLRALGVRYVVVHRKEVGLANAARIEARAAAAGVGLVKTFGNEDLYVLKPLQAQQLSDAMVDLQLPTTIARDAPADAVITLENHSDLPVVIPVGSRLNATIAWDGATPRRVEGKDLPLFLNAETSDATGVPLDGVPPPGLHSLTFTLTEPVERRIVAPVTVVPHLASSQSREGLRATFANWQVPAHVIAGQPFSITVEAQNAGTAGWLNQTAGHRGQVGLGLEGWYTQNGTLVTGPAGETYGARGWLAANVLPGQRIAASMTATAPPTPGSYDIKVAMVSEQVAWFSDATFPDGHVFHIDVTR